MSVTMRAVERGFVPDAVVRAGIRRLLRQRLREAAEPGVTERFIQTLSEAPVALVPDLANAQHYEVPPDFFAHALGPRRKYSCCWFDTAASTLADAEDAMLKLTCERAGIEDGMDVLDLGCGWGAGTLWIAEEYPTARVTGVSNSSAQRASILREATARRLSNVSVTTADINTFNPGRTFDRIVSVEMFEHARNWPALLERVRGWLRPGGRLFVHIFCHDRYAYPYEDRGAGDWMARHFFSGGMMPSYDLLPRMARGLSLVERWQVPGTHYARTCRAWLENVDEQREAIEEILGEAYGERDAAMWTQRWRMFFMACEELFAYRGGREWYVGHYLFERGA